MMQHTNTVLMTSFYLGDGPLVMVEKEMKVCSIRGRRRFYMNEKPCILLFGIISDMIDSKHKCVSYLNASLNSRSCVVEWHCDFVAFDWIIQRQAPHKIIFGFVVLYLMHDYIGEA